MKKTMTKRLVAFMLVVMMLATNCISFTASAASLTITAAPAATDGSTIRDDSADASVLTDGVKTGSYNGGDAVTTQGTDKWTDYTLSFGSSTTIDTLVVYGAAPTGDSWNISDDAAYYSLSANGASVAIESVSVDRTNEAYPVATIKFAATKASSFVLSIKNPRYCSAIFEIEAVEVASSDDTNVSEDTSDKYLGFDMSATLNADDSSIIDVVLSIKDIKQQLDAVEFLLTFDPAIVEGVVQESEAPMDVFMTKVPMYTMVVQGMEFQMPRYEQICTYEPDNKYYHLRFIDLLQYASAKEGEEYLGLINDGDLVVTIQFRIVDANATEFTFTATDVKGTTTGELVSVPGASASATYKAGAVEPTTSEAPVEPTTSEEVSEGRTPVDLGDEFFANINVPALDKTFTKVGADVKATDADGSDEQIWKFVKIDATNAYVISNLVEGGYLAVQGELSSALANVYISIDAQEYYIYEVNGKYAISPVGYDNKAVDVNGVDFNVQYWDFNEANACQQYDIIKVELDDTTSEDVTSEDVTSEDVTSEDVTSEDVTSEDVTSEDVTSEDVTSEDVTSEDVTSEDVTSEDVTSEDVTSEDVTSDDVTSDDVTSEDVTSDDVTSEDVTSEDVTSEDVTSEDVTSEDVTSEDVTSEDVTSEDVTSEDVTSEDVTSEDVTSDDVTSDDVTSEDVTSEDVTSDDVTSDDVTSDDVTSDDVTSDDVTSDDVTSDDVTSDDVTSDDVTSDDVTSDDVTSDDVTSDDVTSDESSETPVKPGDAGIVMFAVLAVLALAALVVCKKARRA